VKFNGIEWVADSNDNEMRRVLDEVKIFELNPVERTRTGVDDDLFASR
jgi:hypothetical protein